ncbi:MAG: 50S ribosomal protein L18 [Planctomycetota bacterium]
MTQQDLKWDRRERRARSVRKALRAQVGRPRLSVFRSVKHISVQIIDDLAGRTLACASTHEKEIMGTAAPKKLTKSEQSRVIGESIAKRAKEKGIEHVVFDRGPFRYHGRVKALADAARKAGLKF